MFDEFNSLVIAAAQRISFDHEVEPGCDPLIAAAGEIMARDYEPLNNDAVSSNGRNSFALFVPAKVNK